VLAGLFGCPTLHDSLTRELDLTLPVNVNDHDHDLVAYTNYVPDARHPVIR
jgi:hypothetical protein